MICVPTFVDSMTAALYVHIKINNLFISYVDTECYFYVRSESGFPNDIHTYGLLSGIWSSSFALGAFLGPSIAGFLYDLVGFEKGTYFEIFLHLSLVSKVVDEAFSFFSLCVFININQQLSSPKVITILFSKSIYEGCNILD